MSDNDANYIRDLAATKLANHIASLEGERGALLAALGKILLTNSVDSSMNITKRAIWDMFPENATGEDGEVTKAAAIQWYTAGKREHDETRDKLAAAVEDAEFLRSLLKTIVEEVSGVYGGHSLESIEALRVAQKLLEGGKPDG